MSEQTLVELFRPSNQVKGESTLVLGNVVNGESFKGRSQVVKMPPLPEPPSEPPSNPGGISKKVKYTMPPVPGGKTRKTKRQQFPIQYVWAAFNICKDPAMLVARQPRPEKVRSPLTPSPAPQKSLSKASISAEVISFPTPQKDTFREALHDVGVTLTSDPLTLADLAHHPPDTNCVLLQNDGTFTLGWFSGLNDISVGRFTPQSPHIPFTLINEESLNSGKFVLRLIEKRVGGVLSLSG